MSQDFYAQITNESELKLCLDTLASDKSRFQLQIFEKSEAIVCSVKERLPTSIDIRVISGDATGLVGKASVIVLFQVGEDLMLTKTTVTEDQGRLNMDLQQPIYKVQRRENFRLRFPVGHEPFADIKTIDGKTAPIKVQLQDVSGGGFSTEFVPPWSDRMKSGSELRGVLRLGSEINYEFRGVIRLWRCTDEKKKVFRAGVKLLDLASKDQDKIVFWIMRVHRQLFSALARNPLQAK